jgi:hypothetical protein
MNIPPKSRDNGVRIGVEDGNLVVIIHGEGVRLNPASAAQFAQAAQQAAMAAAAQAGASEAVQQMCPDCVLKYSRHLKEQAEKTNVAAPGDEPKLVRVQ